MTEAPVLQEGIFHAKGQRPGGSFALLFLRANRGLPDLRAADVGAAFGRLWRVYQDLKAGAVADLPGHPVPAGGLTVLAGYGRNCFSLPGAGRATPEDVRRWLFLSPQAPGGGPLLRGAGLSYAPDVQQNRATEDIAVQLIADTPLAVNRAVVETWKHLHDEGAASADPPVLQPVAFYTGFQRDDGRSWIDFHDGLSNMPSEARHGAIAIKPSGVPQDAWLEGGTYLAFIRLSVDLAVWRSLTRAQQEAQVGRDKLTGCPIASIGTGQGGEPVAVAGCPVAGRLEVGEGSVGVDPFREAGRPADVAVQQSHIHRARQPGTGSPDVPNSLRVFRQGYEFMEASDAAPGFRLGLNFVSFQDTPQRLFRILTQDTWLGRTNFGGDPARPLPGMDRLLAVRAAAVYLVPPVTPGEPFPGGAIFGTA